MAEPKLVDRPSIAREFERARTRFHQLLEEASTESLSQPSAGTRWTNEQLLFHMLFGYMIVQALLVLVRVIGRLPAGVGRLFARTLDAGTWLFDVVNYYGSCAAALVFNRRRMGAKLDRVIPSLTRRLERESEEDLNTSTSTKSSSPSIIPPDVRNVAVDLMPSVRSPVRFPWCR